MARERCVCSNSAAAWTCKVWYSMQLGREERFTESGECVSQKVGEKDRGVGGGQACVCMAVIPWPSNTPKKAALGSPGRPTRKQTYIVAHIEHSSALIVVCSNGWLQHNSSVHARARCTNSPTRRCPPVVRLLLLYTRETNCRQLSTDCKRPAKRSGMPWYVPRTVTEHRLEHGGGVRVVKACKVVTNRIFHRGAHPSA